jgi:exopolyphosphatase / guanosine-5'-triphosphate,3'-diphosphate pyrophosphatase
LPRIAIIDVGSNTAKLIALEYQPGHAWRRLDELRSVVRLSSGLVEGGRLQPKPFARGLAALRTFASYATAAGVDDVVATATSAVRDAANGPDFVAAVRELGLELRILDGEEEARIGSLAVANGLDVREAVTFDLGGGSFQLAELEDRRWRRGHSWPLGAVVAQERFLRSDPPKTKAVKALRAAARNAAAGWWRRDGPPAAFVGLGGTIRNLASVHQKRSGYPLDLLHGYRVPAAALASLADDLLALPASGRGDLPGLNRDRADIIAAGAVVVAEVVAALGADEVVVSGQGLREGLFYPYLLPNAPDHLLDDVRTFSVLNLMRQYHDEAAHNGHVRALALELFDGLRPWHPYGATERELLGHAAWIHDIGMAVDYDRHEHHGMALTLGRALPGFSHREQLLLALLVRYHRKGTPAANGYDTVLQPADLERLRLLAGVLRLAEYLERGKAQRVTGVDVRGDGTDVVVSARSEGDVHVEIEAAGLRRDLLAQALGRPLRVVGRDDAVVAP